MQTGMSATFTRKTEVNPMGINKFNQEGYFDPTAFEALTAIEQEVRQTRNFLKRWLFSPLKILDAQGVFTVRKLNILVVLP